MKVTDLTYQVYRWKRDKPIRNGKYTYANAGLNVAKIETDVDVQRLCPPKWSGKMSI